MNPLENQPATPQPLRMPLSRPRWTYILIGIIAVIFLLEELAGRGNGGSENPDVLIQFGANYAPLVSTGQYWRLFTANFLHIGILHIMLNAYSLYIIGQEVEAWYGASRFMAIFLLTCISGALASFALTYGLSAGASTGIVGLIGAEAAFFIRNRKIFGALGSRRLNNLFFIVVINVIFGLSNPGIDNFGHLGGLIGGLTLGWLLCPFYQIEQRSDGTRRVIDLNSLKAEWLGVILFGALLVVAFYAALTLHRA